MRSSSSNTSSASSSSLSASQALYDLETLFIEKLQEKYKLNLRDIKRAFSRFDKDNNGLLDLTELIQGIQLFLNGVKRSQVEDLVRHYDLNGDGKISYEEFLSFLQSRAAVDLSDQQQQDMAVDDDEDDVRPPRQRSTSRGRGRGSAWGAPAGGGGDAVPSKHNNKNNAIAYYDDGQEEGQYDYDQDQEDEGPADEAEDYFNADVPLPPSQYPVEGRQRGGAPLSRGRGSSRPSTSSSDTPSVLDLNNPQDLQYRAKIFLQNLHHELCQRAIRLRLSGKVPHAKGMHLPALQVSVARDLLMKTFQPYTGQGEGRSREKVRGIEFADFVRVLRSFSFPGNAPVRTETLQYLFDLCIPPSTNNTNEGSSGSNGSGVNHLADINLLLHLLFGPATTQGSGGGSGSTTTAVVPPLSVGVALLQDKVDPQQQGGFVEQVDRNRTLVGVGPVRFPTAVDRPSVGNSLLQQQDDGKTPSGGASGGGGGSQLAVPLRFVSRKSRTALTVPASWDSSVIQRSTTLPPYQLYRKHIFGMSSTRYSNNAIYALPRPTATTTTTPTPTASNPNYLDSATIVYSSAALGIVHDLSCNTQSFLQGPSDDITCLTLSNCGRYVAAGCIGKQALIYLWDLSTTTTTRATSRSSGNNTSDPILCIGQEDSTDSNTTSQQGSVGRGSIGTTTTTTTFFMRGVSSLAFSYDNHYIIGIGCDDNHMLGIFDLTKQGRKVIEMSAQHGIPPQIQWLTYCPSAIHTEYITREHSGLCDVFVTTGPHHLRLWSFRRPQSGSSNSGNSGSNVVTTAALTYKGLTLSGGSNSSTKKSSSGSSGLTPPKCYTTAIFVPCESSGGGGGGTAYDLLSGGSNGMVYLHRRGILVQSAPIISRGAVTCLVYHPHSNGRLAYCGGVRGIVVVLDTRTLQPLAQYYLLGKQIATMVSSSSSSGSGSGSARVARPQSAGRLGRPTTTTTTSATTTLRRRGSGSGSSSHAAGLHSQQRDDLNIITGRPSSVNDDDLNSDAIVDAMYNEDRQASTNKSIIGLAILPGLGRGGNGGSYLLCVLGIGKVIRLDVGQVHPNPSIDKQRLRPTTTTTTATTTSNTTSTIIQRNYGKDIFYFHTGPVYGLAVDVTKSNRLVVTVGDEKRLLVWDIESCQLLAKTTLPEICRCIHLDKMNSFVTLGSVNGAIYVYFITDQLATLRSFYYTLEQVAYRKDCQGEVTEIKFAPDNKMIALGSRDGSIYVYSCKMEVEEVGQGRQVSLKGSCTLRAMHRLRGHSSTITHLDWSYDSKLLRSTCAAYELLSWDIDKGKLTFSPNPSDVHWKTNHCILGPSVMGIWPLYSDGTDINAIDVHTEKGIVITGNDSGGEIRLLTYPCVVKNAPARVVYGHSSHVMNVRLTRDGNHLISAGGNDSAVMLFDVLSA